LYLQVHAKTFLPIAEAVCVIWQRWVDDYLQWNASKFNGVDRIWIPSEQLWIPDIFISNL